MALVAAGACAAPVASAQSDTPRFERHVRAHGRSIPVESHVDTTAELGRAGPPTSCASSVCVGPLAPTGPEAH